MARPTTTARYSGMASERRCVTSRWIGVSPVMPMFTPVEYSISAS